MESATTKRASPKKLCIECRHCKTGNCYRNFLQVVSLVDGKSIIYNDKENCPSDIYNCVSERHGSNTEHKHCGIDGDFWEVKENV